jgi:hypothetical protein
VVLFDLRCMQVSVRGIDALAAAPALVTGCLTSLDLGGLTRPGSLAMACLTRAWVNAHIVRSQMVELSSSNVNGSSPAQQGRAGAQLHVGLGRTAGVNDLVLEPFVLLASLGALNSEEDQPQREVSDLLQQLQALTFGPSALIQQSWDRQLQQWAKAKQQALQQQPPVSLCRLQLAGCSGISSNLLLTLGYCSVLAGLTLLDLSDMEAFRHPTQPQPQPLQHQHGERAAEGLAPGLTAVSRSSSSSSSSSSSLVVMKSELPQLLQHAGQQLRVLLLDGCYIDGPTAAAVAALRLTQLQQLSLVGCRALDSPGLRCLLASLPGLQQLSIGGSVSGWNERAVLQGSPVLEGLTQLNFVRRPVLRDAELAPLLAAASSLRSLSLIGCYMLTDKVFELAVGSGVKAVSVGHMLGESTVAAAGDASSSNVPADKQAYDAVAPVPPLQQLAQLCITACDGFTGSSIARLQGLRHLRISFCASLNTPALQHVAVSCRKLLLLELPAKSSVQGQGFTPVRFDGPVWSPVQAGSTAGNRGDAGKSGRGTGSVVGGQAGTGRGSAGNTGLVLPQQGGDQSHQLRRLRVNWI